MNSDYLMHHGVKGQKWGVRRYQNADGSLTEAGKRKYTTNNGITLNGEKFRKIQKKDPQAVHKYAAHVGKKVIKNNITDDDLVNIKEKYKRMRKYNEQSQAEYDKHYMKAHDKLKNGQWKSDEDIDTYAYRKAAQKLGKNFEEEKRAATADYYTSLDSMLRNKLGDDVYNTPLYSSRFGKNTLTVGKAATGQILSYLSYIENEERRQNR